MEYPKEVLTTSKKGKIEVRRLIDRGRFVRYEYLDPETGERSEDKVKLVLVKEGLPAATAAQAGETEEYFIIPMKGKRFLLIPAEAKGERKLWDGERVVEL